MTIWRLAYCKACKDIERLPGFDIDFKDPNSHRNDVVLQNWIDRHRHGLDTDDLPGRPGAHPGGRIFPFDMSREGIDPNVQGIAGGTDHNGVGLDLEAMTMAAVEQVKTVLAQNHEEVNEYRDQLREDAVGCHRSHGQPSWPGKPCVDYEAADKRLGSKSTPKQFQRFLCTFCPYESTVTVAKRARRGDYR